MALSKAEGEICLEVELTKQLHAYSDATRNPRQYNMLIVFLARADGIPQATSDAKNISIFTEQGLPKSVVFGHREIQKNYFSPRINRGGS